MGPAPRRRSQRAAHRHEPGGRCRCGAVRELARQSRPGSGSRAEDGRLCLRPGRAAPDRRHDRRDQPVLRLLRRRRHLFRRSSERLRHRPHLHAGCDERGASPEVGGYGRIQLRPGSGGVLRFARRCRGRVRRQRLAVRRLVGAGVGDEPAVEQGLGDRLRRRRRSGVRRRREDQTAQRRVRVCDERRFAQPLGQHTSALVLERVRRRRTGDAVHPAAGSVIPGRRRSAPRHSCLLRQCDVVRQGFRLGR